jgi:hypothetical protein
MLLPEMTVGAHPKVDNAISERVCSLLCAIYAYAPPTLFEAHAVSARDEMCGMRVLGYACSLLHAHILRLTPHSCNADIGTIRPDSEFTIESWHVVAMLVNKVWYWSLLSLVFLTSYLLYVQMPSIPELTELILPVINDLITLIGNTDRLYTQRAISALMWISKSICIRPELGMQLTDETYLGSNVAVGSPARSWQKFMFEAINDLLFGFRQETSNHSVSLLTSNSLQVLFAGQSLQPAYLLNNSKYCNISVFWKQRAWHMMRKSTREVVVTAGTLPHANSVMIAMNSTFIALVTMPTDAVLGELEELHVLLLKAFSNINNAGTTFQSSGTPSSSASAALYPASPMIPTATSTSLGMTDVSSQTAIHMSTTMSEMTVLAAKKHALFALKYLLQIDAEWSYTRLNTLLPTVLNVRLPYSFKNGSLMSYALAGNGAR